MKRGRKSEIGRFTEFAQRIRSAMDAHGLTVGDITRRTGCSRTALDLVLRGEAPGHPGLFPWRKVARVLDLSEDIELEAMDLWRDWWKKKPPAAKADR